MACVSSRSRAECSSPNLQRFIATRNEMSSATQLCDRIDSVLKAREERGLLRRLEKPTLGADFSSNDYLGFAKPGAFQAYVEQHGSSQNSSLSSGSTGSRLLSGHSKLVESVEAVAASFHKSPASLVFNSGYDANLSLLSSLPGPDDAVVHDEFIHASIHDGMKMGRARGHLFSFKHNNIASLREQIISAGTQFPGSIIVCVETVYSMDGDIAPLKKILGAASTLQSLLGREIHVIVDEAHSGGLYGNNGEGLIVHLGLQSHPNLLARVVTFGKAFGAHGAVILTSNALRTYLINYARPFIYSTSLPPHSVNILEAAYAFANTEAAKKARARLWGLVDTFHRLARDQLPQAVLLHEERSPIQGIKCPGNHECMRLARLLREKGFHVYAIRSPTIPKGLERIRIIIHAHNTEGEIERLVKATAETFATLTARPRL